MQHCAIGLPLPFAVRRSQFALALQVYRLRKNANNLYLNALQFAAAVCRESKRRRSIGRYTALAGDGFNWQIKMCSQRKIDAYECQMRAFQIQIYCEKSTQRQKVCYRNVNRLQSNTLARTHTYNVCCSIHTHTHALKKQETSIIQNIRNFKRLSTIAPSSANHAQFVKIISSLLAIFSPHSLPSLPFFFLVMSHSVLRLSVYCHTLTHSLRYTHTHDQFIHMHDDVSIFVACH